MSVIAPPYLTSAVVYRHNLTRAYTRFWKWGGLKMCVCVCACGSKIFDCAHWVCPTKYVAALLACATAKQPCGEETSPKPNGAWLAGSLCPWALSTPLRHSSTLCLYISLSLLQVRIPIIGQCNCMCGTSYEGDGFRYTGRISGPFILTEGNLNG